MSRYSGSVMWYSGSWQCLGTVTMSCGTLEAGSVCGTVTMACGTVEAGSVCGTVAVSCGTLEAVWVRACLYRTVSG